MFKSTSNRSVQNTEKVSSIFNLTKTIVFATQYRFLFLHCSPHDSTEYVTSQSWVHMSSSYTFRRLDLPTSYKFLEGSVANSKASTCYSE
jgi:hypothetical protein